MSAAAPRPRVRHDALHRLYRKGAIGDETWRAVQEIRQIGERLETALMARPGTLGMPGERRRGSAVASPIERLPPALRLALRGHYRRWSDEMARIRVSRSPQVSLLSLTLAAVQHGAAFTDLEAWLGLRRGHGTVRGYVVCALQRYAWLADGASPRRTGFGRAGGLDRHRGSGVR